MKISVLQEDLNRSLSIVSRSVSAKATLPILSHILIGTENGRLKFSATNLETGINLWLGAKIEQEGSITVPARILTELVSSLPPQKIDLEVKGSTLYLSTVNFKASIAGLDPAEFPKIPVRSGEPLMVFSKEELVKAFSQVTIAAAQDEGRPVLTGVLFSLQEGKVTLVATDGYRLSLRNLSLKQKVAVEKLLVPAKTLLEVGRIAQEQGGENSLVEMGLTMEKSQIVFTFPDIELSSRLVEGEFPDFDKIIPRAATTKILFGKEEFLRAVKVASIFAKEQANIVKLKSDPANKGRLIISAETAQVGANESEIEAKIEGENLEIAFNYRFLLDLLGVVDDQEILLETSGPLTPGVFKPAGDEDFLHIIMPVRVQT